MILTQQSGNAPQTTTHTITVQPSGGALNMSNAGQLQNTQYAQNVLIQQTINTGNYRD